MAISALICGALFVCGQASSQVDLIGFDVDGVPKSLTNKGDGTPSPGLRGFMKRAVDKV